MQKLTALGYRFDLLDGDRIHYEWQGPGNPDPGQVASLIDLVRADKDAVRAYLKTLVLCQDCDHAEVGDGWAICRTEPWDGIRGQAPDLQHPCPNFKPRTKSVLPPEKILTCSDCPWHRANPWMHFPELPAWCDWHFDHLAADNPACIGYLPGRGHEPDPHNLTRHLRR